MSVNPYVRFLVRCRTRYAMQKKQSLLVAIHAASECEFVWEIWEMMSLIEGLHEFWWQQLFSHNAKQQGFY